MNRKDIFYLSLLAHELKSPLNTILNTTKLIELTLDENNLEKIKNYLCFIISEILYLKNYISNTIELGKIELGKRDIIVEEVDLLVILKEIVEITRILIGNKPIEVKTDFPYKKFLIYSDPVILRQILLNIASNAAKYTQKGHILYSLMIFPDSITIKIEDTGRGMDRKVLEQIFTPYFSMPSNPDIARESSGIGLYVTKKLLKLINGSISIESVYGKGTSVYISIPSNFKKQ